MPSRDSSHLTHCTTPDPHSLTLPSPLISCEKESMFQRGFDSQICSGETFEKQKQADFLTVGTLRSFNCLGCSENIQESGRWWYLSMMPVFSFYVFPSSSAPSSSLYRAPWVTHYHRHHHSFFLPPPHTHKEEAELTGLYATCSGNTMNKSSQARARNSDS